MKTKFNFILLKFRDGCGGQLLRLALAMRIAKETEKRVLFDLSWYPAFRHSELLTAPLDLFDDIESIDDRLIIHPAEIARVLDRNSDEVLFMATHDRVYASEEAKRLGVDYMIFSTFLNHYSDCIKGKPAIDVFESIRFKSELLERYEHLKSLVSNRVGIHARMGNGEVYVRPHDFHGQRFTVRPESFFEFMDSIDDDFLVCSDSQLFIDACKSRYPQRVVSLDGANFGLGQGPSHLPGVMPQRLRPDITTRVVLLKEALLQVRLLGQCKELICNESAFSDYARNTVKVPSTLVTSSEQRWFHDNRLTDNSNVVLSGGLRLQLIKELVQDKDAVLLEIGANRGTHTKHFIQDFPDARIFCFEPDPRALKRLREAVGDVEQVRIIPAAVGACDGTQEFYQSSGLKNPDQKVHFPDGWDASGSLRAPKEHLNVHTWCKFESTIEVPVVTLNSVCRDEHLETIDFVWMDVQGAEEDVFKGASSVLPYIRFIYTEYNNKELYEGQLGLKELLKMLPDFEVLIRFKCDALLWNTRFHLPFSYELQYELNCVYLEKVKQGLV